VLLALLAAANYFLWQQRASLAERQAAARQKGELMLNALGGRDRIDADLSALREAMAYIEENLVDERSMEVNLGYFYRQERATRVRIVRLNQLAAPVPPAGSRFKPLSFSLQVTGSYRNHMAFLRALETGPRLLRIRKCSLERSEKDRDDLMLDLTVDMLAKA